nr:metal-dependent hydrolase [Halorubrum vacuolatum]
MLPTHAVVGLALAAPLLVLAPDLSTAALTGALLGSVFPDLDLYAGHRRTLHYPVIYTALAVPAAVAAFVIASPLVVGIAAFLVGAAVHCRMDRYGGGLELRPWEGTSEKAVYDHVRGRWRRPKRWIEYDGSPGDLLLLASLGVPLLFVLEGPFRLVVVVCLAVGTIYVVLRRRLAAIAPTVFAYVPDRLARYVPERYRP